MVPILSFEILVLNMQFMREISLILMLFFT